MSARAFARSLENLSHESVPQQKRRFSAKVVVLATVVVLLFGLFIFQQVRVETALRRIPVIKDGDENLGYLEQEENSTSDAADSDMDLAELTERLESLNSSYRQMSYFTTHKINELQDRLKELDSRTTEEKSQMDDLLQTVKQIAQRLNTTQVALEESVSALAEAVSNRTETVEARLLRVDRLANDSDRKLANFSFKMERLVSTVMELGDIQARLDALEGQSWALSQNMSTLTENLKGLQNSLPSSAPPENCGGSIELGSGVTELQYQVAIREVPHGCVWVVKNRYGGSITVTRPTNPANNLSVDKFTLGAAINPSSSNCSFFNLGAGSQQSFTTSLVFIFFYGPRYGTGFRLTLHGDSGSENTNSLTFVKKLDRFTYRYPPSGGHYLDNQLFAFVAAPWHRQRARITVQDILTEATHDWVSVMWIESGSTNFNCVTKSGPARETISEVSERDSPVLVFFYSDHSVTNEGFLLNAEFY